MPDFVTDAVLLKKIEYGDHDYIISFLSRDHGKISVIAKNAKKSVKRFSGALDLFSVHQIHCTLPQKKKDAMIVLSRADLDQGYVNIRYDVFKTAYASFWIELIYFWVEEGKPQEKLFELLCFSLSMLDKEEIDKEIISLLFQIRFMEISGLSPGIEQCETCGLTLDLIGNERIWFDFQDGRIACPGCISKKNQRGMMVSKGTLKQLYWVNHTPAERIDRIRFSPLAIREGERLLESFIPFHVGRNFKSLVFLEQLRKMS